MRKLGAFSVVGVLAAGLVLVLFVPIPRREPYSSVKKEPHNTYQAADIARSQNPNSGPLPLMVQIVPSPQTPEEAARDAKKEQRSIAHERWDVRIGVGTGVILFLQFLAFSIQAGLLRKTINKMDEVARGQTADMGKSIAEAARAASAMRSVAESMGANVEQVKISVKTSKNIAKQQRLFGRMQMRAYISVLVGQQATYQDSGRGDRFSVSPVMVNTGPTPAKNVQWRISADILPNPLPPDFKFRMPQQREGKSIVGPQQSAVMTASVDHLVDDADVAAIKRGWGRALYVWGMVSYDDVFRRRNRTTFAQWIYWAQCGPMNQNWEIPEVVQGVYLHKHNRAS